MRTLLTIVERRAPWLLAVYLLILLTATHYPVDVLPRGDVLEIDKVVHFAAYAVVGALVGMCLPAGSAAGVVLRATLIAVGVGALDEVTQPWANRICDPFDLLADALGAALGAWLWVTLHRRTAAAAPATE